MTKVALVTPNLTYGGAERWLVTLATQFHRVGVHVTGVVASGWGGIDPTLSAELQAVTTVHSHGTGDRPAHARIWDTTGVCLHDSLQAALSHVCKDADVLLGWGDVGMGSIVPSDVHIPFVVVSHTTMETDKMKPVHPRITHFAAVSQVAANYFADRLGSPAMKDVRVIYNGVSPQRVAARRSRDEMLTEWGCPLSAKIVGMLGRVSPEKQPQLLAASLAHLPAGWFGVLHGERQPVLDPRFDSYATLMTTATNAGVTARLRCYGAVADIGDVLGATDVSNDAENDGIRLVMSRLQKDVGASLA